MPGIPTEYAGIRFRSRLEAKWAAFFDLMGWRWTYEPFDLAGYIPDFSIAATVPLLVEVKPATTREQLETAAERIVAAGWVEPFVVVGADLFRQGDLDPTGDRLPGSSPILGAGTLTPKALHDEIEANYAESVGFDVSDVVPWPVSVVIGNEIEFHYCAGCGKYYPYSDYPCCLFCGRRWERGDRPGDESLIFAAFAAATNRVQWRGEFGA